MDQKELESRARHIQVESRKAVLEQLAGQYRSAFKGVGVEFEDIREYTPGDDVRAIDWNVTARTGKPHVKAFKEERELTLYFLIDVSGSSHFGSGGVSKREVAARVFSLLAYAAAHHHDNVGLILFTDEVEVHLKARKGQRGVMRMIDAIMCHEPRSKGTCISGAIDYFNQVRSSRCVVFLFSDFFDNTYHEVLGDVARQHDLICVSFSDVREQSLPDSGMLTVQDAESGAIRTIDCKGVGLRAGMRVGMLERRELLERCCYESDAELLCLQTEDDVLHRLIAFFKERGKKGRGV